LQPCSPGLEQLRELWPAPGNASARPDQRALGQHGQLDQLIEALRGGRRRFGRLSARVAAGTRRVGQILQIDRPFHADRAAWHGEGGPNGLAQDPAGFLDGTDGVGGLRDCLEHAELVLGLVDEAAPRSQVLQLDLPSHVQHGGACAERLDEGSGRVAGTGAGAREGAAEAAGRSGVPVSGVDRGCLVPDGHETEVPRDRLDEGQVVHGDDAEDGVHSSRAQHVDEQFAAVGVAALGAMENAHCSAPHAM
jgi:hypothetical protein